MDNTQLPAGGDPQDYTRTQELGPAGAHPWQRPGRPKPPRRHSRMLWWSAGLALVAVLAGGGAYAATALASSASPAGPTGQAAQLNSLLKSAGWPSAASAAGAFARTTASTAAKNRCQDRAAKAKAAGHAAAAQRLLRLCRSRLARVRLVGGLHGSFTFKTKTGTTTLAYIRGGIQSVSSSDVVVKAADGTTWTWALGSSTVIREGGKKVTASALADGGRVFVAGPVTSGKYQARLIVIARTSATRTPSSVPSPSPAPASGS